jgi:hypothetical protein
VSRPSTAARTRVAVLRTVTASPPEWSRRTRGWGTRRCGRRACRLPAGRSVGALAAQRESSVYRPSVRTKHAAAATPWRPVRRPLPTTVQPALVWSDGAAVPHRRPDRPLAERAMPDDPCSRL